MLLYLSCCTIASFHIQLSIYYYIDSQSDSTGNMLQGQLRLSDLIKCVWCQSKSLIRFQSVSELRWAIWSCGLHWLPALFVFFARRGFTLFSLRPFLQFRFMEIPPNRKLLFQDDRQRWWGVRHIATGSGTPRESTPQSQDSTSSLLREGHAGC